MTTQVVHEHGRCPRCSKIIERSYDYDVLGNPLFHCTRCGCVFAHPPDSVPVVVDSNGF